MAAFGQCIELLEDGCALLIHTTTNQRFFLSTHLQSRIIPTGLFYPFLHAQSHIPLSAPQIFTILRMRKDLIPVEITLHLPGIEGVRLRQQVALSASRTSL